MANYGCYVVSIDVDETLINKYADILAQAVIADARDEDALKDAGVDQCDAIVIAVGDDLEANIVSVMNARVLGIENIWVKSNSKVQRRILRKLGVTRVINPEKAMGHRIAQLINNPFVTDYLQNGTGISVVSFKASEKVIGKTYADVQAALDDSLQLLGLLRDTQIHGPEYKIQIEASDILLLAGTPSNLQDFGERWC